jgi:hypothetical protein
MSGVPENLICEDVEHLQSLAERCGRGTPPAKLEVEEALERGLASLMALQARLYEESELADEESELADGGPELTPIRPVRAELLARAEVLRRAVTELRRRATAADSCYLASGFVLPAKR